jgi:hypothetical protein
MRRKIIAWCVAVATMFSVAGLVQPASAQPNKMKACGSEWQALKQANQTAGKTWAAFRKECMAKGGSLAAEAGGPDAGKSKRRARSGGGKPVSPARAAMQERQRACAAEWKADKAAGKTKGSTWPKYWSACNARKKGASA